MKSDEKISMAMRQPPNYSFLVKPLSHQVIPTTIAKTHNTIKAAQWYAVQGSDTTIMPRSTSAGIIILKSFLVKIADSLTMLQPDFVLYQIPKSNAESKRMRLLSAAQLLVIKCKSPDAKPFQGTHPDCCF